MVLAYASFDLWDSEVYVWQYSGLQSLGAELLGEVKTTRISGFDKSRATCASSKYIVECRLTNPYQI